MAFGPGSLGWAVDSTVRGVERRRRDETIHAGQVGAGRVCRRFKPAVSRAAQGASLLSDSQVCRDLRASFAAIHSSRSRSRLGSHRRPSVPARASICIQAVSSIASWTMAIQILFWAKSCSGRFRNPVSLAPRIRSSQRARRRCRSSSSGRSELRLLVAKAVNR